MDIVYNTMWKPNWMETEQLFDFYIFERVFLISIK